MMKVIDFHNDDWTNLVLVLYIYDDLSAQLELLLQGNLHLHSEFLIFGFHSNFGSKIHDRRMTGIFHPQSIDSNILFQLVSKLN